MSDYIINSYLLSEIERELLGAKSQIKTLLEEFNATPVTVSVVMRAMTNIQEIEKTHDKIRESRNKQDNARLEARKTKGE